MQTKLAIAIPTYNRAGMLHFNLLQILDELIAFEIPVYVSDDSTNEETASFIEELKRKHSLFYYRKNEVRLGHDLNCLSTISYPSETYVWYLGDSMIIKKGAIKKIIACVQDESYDFISCNAEGRNLSIEDNVYEFGNDVFRDLCWHLTMTGVTIYNKKKLLDLTNFEILKFKNFPQTAIIFEQFASKESKLLWINDKLIFNNPNKNSYWAHKVFEVFIDDFRNFLYNLPNYYSLKSKDKVLLQHSVQTGIFSYHSFVIYRTQLFFNYTIFKKYKNDFKKVTNANTQVLMIISLIWVAPLKILHTLFKKCTELLI